MRNNNDNKCEICARHLHSALQTFFRLTQRVTLVRGQTANAGGPITFTAAAIVPSPYLYSYLFFSFAKISSRSIPVLPRESFEQFRRKAFVSAKEELVNEAK